jgi:hypothetical protein
VRIVGEHVRLNPPCQSGDNQIGQWNVVSFGGQLPPERGRESPTLDNLVKIARALNRNAAVEQEITEKTEA